MSASVIRSIMQEVEAVSHKLGMELPISIDQRIAGAEKVGEHKTSMLQDFEAGRPMELEALVVRLSNSANGSGFRCPIRKRCMTAPNCWLRVRSAANQKCHDDADTKISLPAASALCVSANDVKVRFSLGFYKKFPNCCSSVDKGRILAVDWSTYRTTWSIRMATIRYNPTSNRSTNKRSTKLWRSRSNA